MENAEVRSKKGGVILPWLLVLGLLGLGGYGYWFGHRPVADELQKKEVELAKVSGEVQRSQTAVNAANAERDKAQEELKQARADLAQSTAQKDADQKLLDELKKQVGAGSGDVQGGNGQITVTMVDKVLFKSGEADLSPEGELVLRRIGTVLRGVDKLVEVDGHTDAEAVKSEVRELYPTNWELSTARATNVVRFLQEDTHVNARHLKAAGFGPYRPVASNKTANGRAKNRRIEILLLPNRMKVDKGDFADELAAADKQLEKKSTKKVALPTDKQRLAAVKAKKKR
jgi:chemotaxis protein MotB